MNSRCSLSHCKWNGKDSILAFVVKKTFFVQLLLINKKCDNMKRNKKKLSPEQCEELHKEKQELGNFDLQTSGWMKILLQQKSITI
jgi:hypothetical protein